MGGLLGGGLHLPQLAPCPPSLSPLSHELTGLLWDLALALLPTSQLLPMLMDPVPVSPPSEVSLRSLRLPPLSSNSTLFLPVISLLC